MPFGIKKRTFVLSELMAINAEGGSAPPRCDVSTETAGARETSACKFETFDKLSDGTSGAGGLGGRGAATGNVLHSNACFLPLALRGGGGDSSIRGGAKRFRLASMVGFRSSFSVVLGGSGKEDSLLNAMISGHAARMDLNPAHTLGGHHLPCGGNCCKKGVRARVMQCCLWQLLAFQSNGNISPARAACNTGIVTKLNTVSPCHFLDIVMYSVWEHTTNTRLCVNCETSKAVRRGTSCGGAAFC